MTIKNKLIFSLQYSKEIIAHFEHANIKCPSLGVQQKSAYLLQSGSAVLLFLVRRALRKLVVSLRPIVCELIEFATT